MILKDILFQKPKIIKCEENVDDINKASYAYEDNNTSNNDSIIDILKKIPINPFIDSNENINKYKHGVEKKSIDRYTGVQVYEEDDEKDHKKNKPVDYPFPINKNVVFKKNKVNQADERINTNYSNIASDLYPEEGFKTLNKNKHFSSDWELLLAHNHGLYNFKNSDNNAIINKDMSSLNTENDIRNKLNLYTERINVDNPNDACKYLAIEE
ncbi:conserved Plasmodium protein, unknown function, partial [Plasmodium ovale curtisi]